MVPMGHTHTHHSGWYAGAAARASRPDRIVDVWKGVDISVTADL